jgi:NAD+ kinase
MKVAVHSKSFEVQKLPYIKQILDEIVRRKFQLEISSTLHQHLLNYGVTVPSYSIFSSHKELNGTNLMISVGGDGTFLETVTLVRNKDIPILGINTGTLGFLATTQRDKIKEVLDAIFNGFYTIEERTLIALESEPSIFGDLNFGMNEFTIIKRDTSSMIIVHTFLNGDYLNSYWADGLIVSTPTGSTGYSLSVGGPVVDPRTNNFIIAPISPHNLNVRPLIVSDNSVISFEIAGRSKNFLVSLDSRSMVVDASIQMAVRKCDFNAKLIKLTGEGFLKTLRVKLNWGLDTRN